ncbi:T3SS effector NleG family protein [Escherichia coli]|uniref:T3SS effector NleG family protein n=1 Tax=Escherichia coli TaxID=562 RepID=UPI002379F2A3|nr:T3SS effector NleG family protein [Escherichia coli]
MPFAFYLSSENQLSIQDVEVLQNAARANDTGNIIIGDRQLSVRYQSAMDAFIVNPVQGELYSGLNNTALDDVLSLADVIESQLNGGSSFLDAFDRYMIQTMQTMMNSNERDLESLATRLSSSAFSVSPENISCIPDALQCPITLAIPERGVFLETPRDPLCVVYMMKMLSLV